MSLHTTQITATTSSATRLVTVPNGVASAVITNDGNSSVLVGTSPNVTSSTGLAIPPNTSVSFSTYAASRGCDLYVLVATGGSSQPVSILLSTTD